MNDSNLIDDSGFRLFLAARSRLRWVLSGIVVFAYLAYGLAGLYARDAMGLPFAGWSIPRVLVFGYAIIALAIALSLFYIWRVNALAAEMRANLRASGSERDK